MKGSWVAVGAVALVLCLSGCGGSSPAAKVTSSGTAKVVPNVVGMNAIAAVAQMNNALLNSTLVGPDGAAWTDPASDSAKVVSTDPAAGASDTSGTVKLVLNVNQSDAEAADAKASAAAVQAEASASASASAAAAAAELAARYTVTCESQSASFDDFKSYKDVWKSPDFEGNGTCFTKIAGEQPDSTTHIPLLPSEQAIVNIVASKGGDTRYSDDTFADVYTLCASVPKNYPSTITGGSTTADVKAEIQGALALCPDAPHAALLQQALSAVNYSDGNYSVGQTMEPGTYSTAPGVRSCYWSRTNGGGDIIANDFIDYAPDGVTVTVYAGEGFTSNGCGVWTKAG